LVLDVEDARIYPDEYAPSGSTIPHCEIIAITRADFGLSALRNRSKRSYLLRIILKNGWPFGTTTNVSALINEEIRKSTEADASFRDRIRTISVDVLTGMLRINRA